MNQEGTKNNALLIYAPFLELVRQKVRIFLYNKGRATWSIDLKYITYTGEIPPAAMLSAVHLYGLLRQSASLQHSSKIDIIPCIQP